LKFLLRHKPLKKIITLIFSIVKAKNERWKGGRVEGWKGRRVEGGRGKKS
jgi:hypothetical protein